jgi:hypothetical protein
LVAYGLAVVVGLAGCGSLQAPKLPAVAQATVNTRCDESQGFLVGLLVVDPARGLVVQEEGGETTELLLRFGHSVRWSGGGFLPWELEVLNEGGTVLAVTGRRYRVGGSAFSTGDVFWACNDVFVPQ